MVKELTKFYQVAQHSHQWVRVSILAAEILNQLNDIFCDVNHFGVVVGGLDILRADLDLVKLLFNYFKVLLGLPVSHVSFRASDCHALLNNFRLLKWVKHWLRPFLEIISLRQIDFLRVAFPLSDLFSELDRGSLGYLDASDAYFGY